MKSTKFLHQGSKQCDHRWHPYRIEWQIQHTRIRLHYRLDPMQMQKMVNILAMATISNKVGKYRPSSAKSIRKSHMKCEISWYGWWTAVYRSMRHLKHCKSTMKMQNTYAERTVETIRAAREASWFKSAKCGSSSNREIPSLVRMRYITTFPMTKIGVNFK